MRKLEAPVYTVSFYTRYFNLTSNEKMSATSCDFPTLAREHSIRWNTKFFLCEKNTKNGIFYKNVARFANWMYWDKKKHSIVFTEDPQYVFQTFYRFRKNLNACTYIPNGKYSTEYFVNAIKQHLSSKPEPVVIITSIAEADTIGKPIFINSSDYFFTVSFNFQVTLLTREIST